MENVNVIIRVLVYPQGNALDALQDHLKWVMFVVHVLLVVFYVIVLNFVISVKMALISSWQQKNARQ